MTAGIYYEPLEWLKAVCCWDVLIELDYLKRWLPGPSMNPQVSVTIVAVVVYRADFCTKEVYGVESWVVRVFFWRQGECGRVSDWRVELVKLCLRQGHEDDRFLRARCSGGWA